MLYSFYDIGANIGWHAWNCRAYIQDVPIHVFEPDNNNILLINRTIQHSALTGITVHSVALSDKDCESYFHLDTITSATGTLEISQKSWKEKYLGHKAEKTIVQFLRLDHVAYNATPHGVMIIDVEGHQTAVLIGAESIIRKHLPALVIESFPPKTEEVCKIINKIGYLTFDAVTLDPKTDKTTNILALHPTNKIFPAPTEFTKSYIHNRTCI